MKQLYSHLNELLKKEKHYETIERKFDSRKFSNPPSIEDRLHLYWLKYYNNLEIRQTFNEISNDYNAKLNVDFQN